MLLRLLRLVAALLLLTFVGVLVAAAANLQLNGPDRRLDPPVDAAIVLGSGLDRDGSLDHGSRRRVAAGVALLAAGSADRLIMSGGVLGGSDNSVATIMAAHAASLGAPVGAVLVEGDSDTTFENLRFSTRLTAVAGMDRLAVVTDDYHLLRARLLACYFDRCGVRVVAVPALGREGWSQALHDALRETAAWWYNLGKVVLWSALGAAGIPDEGRERYVQ